jgi:hypothetical protein
MYHPREAPLTYIFTQSDLLAYWYMSPVIVPPLRHCGCCHLLSQWSLACVSRYTIEDCSELRVLDNRFSCIAARDLSGEALPVQGYISASLISFTISGLEKSGTLVDIWTAVYLRQLHVHTTSKQMETLGYVCQMCA